MVSAGLTSCQTVCTPQVKKAPDAQWVEEHGVLRVHHAARSSHTKKKATPLMDGSQPHHKATPLIPHHKRHHSVHHRITGKTR